MITVRDVRYIFVCTKIVTMIHVLRDLNDRHKLNTVDPKKVTRLCMSLFSPNGTILNTMCIYYYILQTHEYKFMIFRL